MEHNKITEQIDFHEATHRYFLKKTGRELIAVSRILELAGCTNYDRVPFKTLEPAAFKGDLVHELCRLYGLGQLKVETLDPLLAGYLESLQRFFKLCVKKVIFVEVIAFDAKLGYAGRIDILYQNHQNRVCLDDYKHGELLPAFKLQSALYENAAKKTFKIQIDERATVRLNANGGFDLNRDRKVYRERQDFHDAVNMIGCAYWKLKNKVKA